MRPATADAPRTRAELKVENYLRLAVKWANRYSRTLGFDEAFSIAQAALVEAGQKWEAERGSFFLIAHEVIRTRLWLEWQRRHRRARINLPSLAVNEDGEEFDLAEHTADPNTPTPEEALIAADERERAERIVAKLLPQLDERERLIVTRLYLDDEDARGHSQNKRERRVATLAELATELGITHQRVQQLEVGLLKRLREAVVTGRAVRKLSQNVPRAPMPSEQVIGAATLLATHG